jgi:peroxiredoxin
MAAGISYKFFNRDSGANNHLTLLEPDLNVRKNLQYRTEFSCADNTGKIRHNTEWDGKVVVMNFLAPWCEACVTEIPILINLQEQYAKQGLQIVGIALGRYGDIKNLLANYPFNYPILLDPDESKLSSVAERFGNSDAVLPYTVVIDRKGMIVEYYKGPITPESLEKLIKSLL